MNLHAIRVFPLGLVVEDDETLCMVASEALRMADYRTEVIKDGRLAQERLAQTTPAIVVLDLHLPQVSGREILRQIRDDRRLDKTRVIVATADPGLAEFLRDDADLVLLKPYSFFQLREFAMRLRPNEALAA